MVDKQRTLQKIDELDRYLRELNQILPKTFQEYKQIEKMRSCERLLQLSIECCIDVAKLFVTGLKLGVPSEESNIFDQLKNHNILSENVIMKLKEMRAFRNILIHEYATIIDEIVFEKSQKNLEDFQTIKKAFLKHLQ